MLTLTPAKSSLINAIKAGFFSTVILNHLTLVLIWGEGGEGEGFKPHTGGASCQNQILPSNLHSYCNQNHTFLLLAESITFLHSYIISIFNIFCKILQHPKINPGSAPGYLRICLLILLILLFAVVDVAVAHSFFNLFHCSCSGSSMYFTFLSLIRTLLFMLPLFTRTLLFIYYHYFVFISVLIQFLNSLCFLFKLFSSLSL